MLEYNFIAGKLFSIRHKTIPGFCAVIVPHNIVTSYRKPALFNNYESVKDYLYACFVGHDDMWKPRKVALLDRVGGIIDEYFISALTDGEQFKINGLKMSVEIKNRTEIPTAATT